jgi:ATP-dependent DNA helicase RecG
VKGLDFEAFENFSSFLRQDYPAYQVLFGVESEEDAVVPVIKRLIQTFPEHDVQLMVTGSVNAMNRKVGLLAALATQARHELLVISDSDVRVPPSYLKEVAAPFSDPKTGIGQERMRIMQSTNDGFKIAEHDLKLRGPGELFGTKQSGLPEFRVADMVHDYRALAIAREDARRLVESEVFWQEDRFRLLRAFLDEENIFEQGKLD